MDYLEFIDRIIDHLKLTFVAERPPPPQVAQHELLMAELKIEGNIFKGITRCFLSIWYRFGGKSLSFRDDPRFKKILEGQRKKHEERLKWASDL